MQGPTPRVSVIIPAYNDAARLERLLIRLNSIRAIEYPNLEIIVAARPSTDGTEAVAEKYGARVVLGGRPSEGRNAGAAAARGKILLFSDADSVPNFGALPRIAKAIRNKDIGTCTAYPSVATFRAMGAVAIQNFLRFSGIARGMSNLLFVDRRIVQEEGIRYDERRNLGEHADFIRRAERQAGAHFRYLRVKRGYEFAVDRYERKGYLKIFFFWFRWWLFSHVLRRSEKKLENEYWHGK